MSILVFAIVVLILVGLVCAVATYIPFPPPVAWLRWVICVLAVVVAILLIAQKAGML